jgi:RNA polymerase sigma-70 factor (ECF subfamily)
METKVFLDKLNEGSDSALEELFYQYFEKLRSLAARKMGAHVPAEPDSIAMSVMGSMVRGFREGRFHVADSRRLWNLLMTITLNKIRKRVEKYHGEESLPSDLEDLLSKDPGPDELAIIIDLVETALAGLDSENRQIFTLYLAGHHRTEIAEQLHLSYATVKYKVKRVTDRLARLIEQADRE